MNKIQKIQDLKPIIDDVYKLEFNSNSVNIIKSITKLLYNFIEEEHFLNRRSYKEIIHSLEEELRKDFFDFFSSSREENERFLIVKRHLINLLRDIFEENKKIFIVHGRNLVMRDSTCAFLGSLKLNWVILEKESNNGETIIEKFLSKSKECEFALVLFSADDVGKVNSSKAILKPRTRQNVILELGYFLSKVGRKNIIILHEYGVDIERPSDFDGIIYVSMDPNGAWKHQLIKELKSAKFYIDGNLSGKV